MCELFTAIGFSIAGAIGGSSAIAGVSTGVATAIGVAAVGASVAAVGGAAMGIAGSIKSARASAAAQKQQAKALQALQENQGTLENSKVTNGLQDNSRMKRTLSSLRVGLLPQVQEQQEITKNVYGVDTNSVTSSTQNMMGLNIAVA